MTRSLLSTVLGKAERMAATWRFGGVGAARKYLRFLYRRAIEKRNYRTWLGKFGELSEETRADIARRIELLDQTPLLSILLPVYNTDEKWLRPCIESVLAQVYPCWELCIADDASTEASVRKILNEYAARDERIKIVFRPENGHISAASNSALELATGEFAVLLDHDDELSPDALFWVANELNDYPETAIIYSDDDLIDESGNRLDPKFKPAFSRDLFYSTNLITHLSAYRTGLVREVGGFRVGSEGSQDYDLGLRVLEHIDESQVRHIPRILYHWRAIKGSVAFSMDEKPYAHERARAAIREHLARCGRPADVIESFDRLHRVRYGMPEPRPSVSIIVSCRDDAAFDAERAGFISGYEVITVQQSDENRAAQLNEAAADASGDMLVFLDGDLTLRDPEALDELIGFAVQTDIGAAGGRILGEDMFVEQSGLVLQDDLSVAYAHADFPPDAPGNISRNLLIGNFSAVSISCMAISRETFESVGGFDAKVIPREMFDVDICLRLWGIKKRIVAVPHVDFVRHGPSPVRRCSADDLAHFRKRWAAYVARDPFCNPNLKRDGTFRIEI